MPKLKIDGHEVEVTARVPGRIGDVGRRLRGLEV